MTKMIFPRQFNHYSAFLKTISQTFKRNQIIVFDTWTFYLQCERENSCVGNFICCKNASISVVCWDGRSVTFSILREHLHNSFHFSDIYYLLKVSHYVNCRMHFPLTTIAFLQERITLITLIYLLHYFVLNLSWPWNT